jgi:GNAT superfamily N-acetyltransferase
MRSLGLATDLLALGPAAEVEDRGDHLVVRTPAEPDFWSGNMVIRRTPPEEPAREEARFRALFPDAAHLLVAWDDPALDPEALRGPWAVRGAEVEVDDVLVREGPPPAQPPPEGYALRLLDPSSDGDWEGAVRLALVVGVEEGYEADAHLPYLRRRFSGRRAMAETGALQWWGAVRDGAVVAQMGLVEDGRLARFQHVDTHPDHRRRGLCAALLAHVGAAARSPVLVIVAEAGGDAGRIYRRAGFAFRERVVAVQRRGY